MDTEEEKQGLAEQDEENEPENQQHDMFVSPLHQVTWILQTMNKAASAMQIEKKMKLSMNVKMIAVVYDAQPPFTGVYSLWKARDGQKQLSFAMNLMSGIEEKAVYPEINGNCIHVELKWPKAMTSIAQFVPCKFLKKLHFHGHTWQPPPMSEESLKSYPFQTVPVVQNLVDQIAMWKLRTKIPGHNEHPTMTFKLVSPIPLDPVPIGNTFELQGLEGDAVTSKKCGYWSGVLLLECKGEWSTFQKPLGLENYTFVHQSMGRWAKEDTDVLMDDAAREDTMCTGKCCK